MWLIFLLKMFISGPLGVSCHLIYLFIPAFINITVNHRNGHAQMSLCPNEPEGKAQQDVASRPVLSHVRVMSHVWLLGTQNIYSYPKLTCIVSIKHIPDRVDLVKKCKNISLIIIILIVFLNGILHLLG